MEIPKIVLTGGPCGGKTTGLAYLKEKLSDLGFNVFIVPEAATMMINGGFDPRILKTPGKILLFQEALLDAQLAMENLYEDYALKIFSGQKNVILCDRGAMDIKAYIPKEYPEHFEKIASERRKSVVELRDEYSGVVHLVTAALGAEEFYTLANNKARLETVEQARIADVKTLECWLGHPHLKVVGNDGDFEWKIKKAFAGVCRFLNIPAPLEIERKFLVKSVDFSSLPPRQKISIEQMYLVSPVAGETLRLRKRGQNGSFIHFLTKKTATDDLKVRNESEKIISPREFAALQNMKDPAKNVISKERICFAWENQYFELDLFLSPDYCVGLKLLEIELTEVNDKVVIPPFLEIEREVTGEEKYYNENLARCAP